MTRNARMMAAVRHQPVDRVPFATYNLHPFGGAHAVDPSYAALLDIVVDKAGMLCKTAVRAVASTDPQVQGRLDTHRERRADETITTAVLHTPKGDLRSVTRKPHDQPALVTEHFIKTDADIAAYMSLPQAARRYDASPLRQMVADLAGRGVAYAGYADPMHAAAVLFDFNDFAVRWLIDPAPIRRLIDFLFEPIRADLAAMLAAAQGLDVLFYTGGPEICTPPMMPPRAFAELVTPYQTELVRMIHAAGFPAALHCHGRVRSVLDEVLRIGFDVIEPIEPPDQGDISLAELLSRSAGRLCLMGHIQDQEFHHAPPGVLTRRVEDIARLVSGRTGYIMTPTCTPFQHPAADTFRRNYEEWLLAADRLLA